MLLSMKPYNWTENEILHAYSKVIPNLNIIILFQQSSDVWSHTEGSSTSAIQQTIHTYQRKLF